MSDSESENFNSLVEESWSIGSSTEIPEKSKLRYENTYKIFKEWCKSNDVYINEKTILEYFVQRTKQLKPGSLWAEYSMLKSTIFLSDSIDISKFNTLVSYLKRKNVGYRPQKASIFTKENVTKFLNEAPDEQFLIHKVGMILGVFGACRREELYNMTIKDIEEREDFIIIKIPNIKTNTHRTFTIINKQIHYLDIFRKYINLRPSHVKTDHIFLNYRNGKCSAKIVGKGAIGSWPSKIATYLNLQNPENFNGHSFRRTSTTLLTNKGVEMFGLKNLGEEAENYMEMSFQSKIEFAEEILPDDDSSTTD